MNRKAVVRSRRGDCRWADNGRFPAHAVHCVEYSAHRSAGREGNGGYNADPADGKVGHAVVVGIPGYDACVVDDQGLFGRLGKPLEEFLAGRGVEHPTRPHNYNVKGGVAVYRGVVPHHYPRVVPPAVE